MEKQSTRLDWGGNLDKKPTEGQIQKFWYKLDVKPDVYFSTYEWKYIGEPRDIDLNNLFKYAVPITLGKIAKEHVYTNTGARTFLFNRWVTRLEIVSDDAIALFQVIQEIIKEGK